MLHFCISFIYFLFAFESCLCEFTTLTATFYSQALLFSVDNSTLRLHKLSFLTKKNESIAFFKKNTFAELVNCFLAPSSLEVNSPFLTLDGTSHFYNFTILTTQTQTVCTPILSELCSNSEKKSFAGSSASFLNSKFSSLTIASPCSLLSCYAVNSVSIFHCVFRNISSSTNHYVNEDSSRFVSMSSCIFSAVENPFYHTIIDSRFSEQLRVSNSSFERCTVLYQNRTYLSGGTKSFRDITFSFDGGSNQGGALCAKGSSDVTISNCSFDKCKVTGDQNNTGRGGALFCENGKCVVSESNFTNCTGSYADGAVSFWFGTKRILHKCRIVECSGPQHFGGMNFEQAPENESQISECEYSKCSCSIDGDSCKGCGGALGIVNPPPHLFITGTTFQNNKAVRHGGAIMCFLALSGSSFRCRFLFFSNNSGRSQGGSDIYTDNNFAGKLDSTQFETCYSFSASPRFVYCDSSGKYDTDANKPNWLPTPSFPDLYVKNGGHDTNDCGNSTSSKECLTLKFSITRWTPIFNQKIIVNGGTYTETSLDISDRVIVADSQTSIPKIVSKISSGTFCTITNGSFSASNLIFVHNSSTSSNAILFSISEADGVLKLIKSTVTAESGQGTSFSKSLFVIDDGHLILDQTTITAIKTSKPVLSLISPREFTTTQTTFSQISRTNGNGSIIEVTLETGKTLSLVNFSLTECSCSEGNGGGMWVYMKAGSSFSLGNATGASVSGRESNANEVMGFTSCAANSGSQPKYGCGGGVFLYLENGATDFIFKDVSFSSCTAESGTDIFINANDLSTVISTATIGHGPELTNLTALNGYERGTINEEYAIPLVVYLWSNFSAPAKVGPNGHDFSRCGFSEASCKTVAKAKSLRFPSVDCSVELMPSFEFSETLALSGNKWSIGCALAGTVISVTSDAARTQAYLVEASVETTFTNITFALPGTLGGSVSHFVSVASGTTTFASCGISMQSGVSSLGFTPICVSAGKLVVRGMSVSSVDFGSSSLLVDEGSTLGTEVDGLTLTDVASTTSVLDLQGSYSVVLKNVEQSYPSGGGSTVLLPGTITGKIEMYSSAISGMERTTEKGGGVECVLSSGADMGIYGCKMSNCKVTGGSGGGMYIQMSSGAKFSIGNGSASSAAGQSNAAGERSVQFVSCSAVKKADNTLGLGGGVFLYLENGATDFIFKDVSFSSCTAESGTDIFINANDLSTVISTATIGHGPELTNLTALNGYERGTINEEYAIPLVVYLWSNFSAPAKVGPNGHDFSRCGFSEASCKTVAKAKSLRFPSVDCSVELMPSFEFSETLALSGNKWSIGCALAGTVISVTSDAARTQAYLVEASVETTFTNITFALPGTLGGSVSHFVSVASGTTTFASCGISMQSGVSSLGFTPICVSAGKLVVRGMSVSSVDFGSSSLLVDEGSTLGTEVDGLTLTDVASTTSVLDLQGSYSVVLKNVEQSYPSGGGSTVLLPGTITGKIEMYSSAISGMERTTEKGGGVECVLSSGADMGIYGCKMSNCKVTGGSGGGMYIQMSSGAKFSIGNGSASSAAGQSNAAGERSVQFVSCSAVKKADNTLGLGGGVFLYLENGATDFIFKDVSFSSCTAESGTDIFINANDLSTVISTATIGHGPELTNLTALNGYERGTINEEYAIPLVVYLWSNFSAPAKVGPNGHDFSRCGFSEASCKTVAKAKSLRFPSVDCSVELMPSFEFSETLALSGNKWSIGCALAGTVISVTSDAARTQAYLVEASVETTFTNITFALPGTLGGSVSHFVSVASGTTTFASCGISMQSGVSSLGFTPICVSAGKLVVRGMSVSSVDFGSSSLLVDEGSTLGTEVDGLTLTDVASTTSVLDLQGSYSVVLKNVEQSYPSGGGSTVLLPGTITGKIEMYSSAISGMERTTEKGGGVECVLSSGADMGIYGCKMSNCKVTGGSGGGMYIQMSSGAKFSIGNGSASSAAGQSNAAGERSVQFVSCSAVKKADNTLGLGGGVFLYLENGATDFIFKDVSFSSCTAESGTDIFINANDLSTVISTATIGHGPELTNLTALNGYERGTINEEYAIPLVVYLWSNFSAPAKVGPNGHDFSRCGFSEASCKTVAKAKSLRFPSVDCSVELMPSFEFSETLALSGNKWSIGCALAGTVISVTSDAARTQAYLVEASVETTFTNITFALPGTLGGSVSHFVSVASGTTTFASCGISMQSGVSSLGFTPICVSAGKLVVRGMSVSSVDFGSSSLLVDEGSTLGTEVDGLTLTDVASTTSVLDLQGSYSVVLKNVEQSYPSGGGSTVLLPGTITGKIEMYSSAISGMERTTEKGGGVECVLSSGADMGIYGCKMSNCKVTGGSGGGMYIQMSSGAKFSIGNGSASSAAGQSNAAGERSVQFVSCSAVKKADNTLGLGGGVFLYLENGATDFIFKDVSFSSCTAESGKNIFVSADSLSAVIKNETIAFGPDLSNSDELRGYDRSSLGDTFAIPLPIYLKPFASPACVGGFYKADINQCGFPSLPCSTINFAATTYFSSTKVEILLVSPFSFNAELKMETNEWDISTTAQGTVFEVSLTLPTAQTGFIESSILSTITNITFSVPQTLTNKDTLLLCSSNTLNVINCGLTASTGVTSIQYSFVKVASGSLLLKNFDASSLSFTAVSFISASSGSQASVNMDNSSFEDITLSNGCIVAADETSILTIVGSNFTRVTRSQGDGGCVAVKSITGVANSKATINNCEFEDINLSENQKNGGSVYLQLSTPTLFEVNNTCFTSSKVQWESPSGEGRGGAVYLSLVDSAAGYTFYSNVTFASNKAKYGPDLFVYSTNLNESVKIEKLNFFNPINDASLLAGEDSSTNGNVVLLKYYLIPRESVISVSSANGVDVAVCGFVAYPCGSLSYAFALGTGDVTLSVIQSSKISQELSLSGRSYTINGDTAGTSALDIVNNGTGTGSFVTCASAVLFSHIECKIPPQLGSHASLFGVGGSTLTLSSCAITKSSSDNLQYTLFNVIQGDLIINELHTTSLTCTKPMLVVNGTNSAAAITDYSFTSASVTTAADALFVICNEASLSLTSSDITNTAQSKPIISSAANCGLNVDRCKVSSLQLTGNSAFHLTKPKEFSIINSNFTTVSASTADGSCISISDDSDTSIGTVTISMCNFTDCKVTGNGNGGAIASSLKSGLNWNVSGCIFDDCHAPSGISDEGKGGAVFITLSVASSNFVIETPSFGTNSAKLGLNLFVISPSLRDSVKETTLPFLKPATESTNRNSDRIYRAQFSVSTATAEAASFDSACGFDAANQVDSIPLVLFFRAAPTTFSVNGTGIDNSVCGYTDYQCKTINFACGRQTALEKEVKTDTNAMSFSEELVLSDAKYNIYGLDANTTLTVASAGTGTDGLVTSSAEATLSHLIFMLPSLLGTHATFISVTSPADPSSATGIEYSFKMSSIAFAIQTAANLNYNIIKATYGQLKMTDCDVSVSDYKKSLFVFSSSVSSVSIEATNFKGFSGTSEPAFTCLAPPTTSNVYTTITLNNTMFKELNQAIDHPASIVKDTFAAWNTTITNATFQSCIAQSSLRGGGLRLCLSMEGELEVSNSMFTNCIASSEGRGGGLYLDCVDPADPSPNPIPELPFRMNSIRFNNNDAKVGKDMFINCHDIDIQIDETLFSLDFDQPSLQTNIAINANDTSDKDRDLIPLITFYKDEFIFLSAVNGNDSRQCGANARPCTSINIGVSHLDTGLVRVVFIKDTTLIKSETKITDATVKPYATSQAIIELNASLTVSNPDASILTLVNEIVMNNVDFNFSESFSSQHKAVLYLQSGSLDAKDISFSSMAELSISPSLFYVAAGEFKLANCTISSVNCISPMFFFSSSAVDVDISNVNCTNSILSSSFIVADDCQFNALNIICSSIKASPSTNFDLISIKVSDKNTSIEKLELHDITLNLGEAIDISLASSFSSLYATDTAVIELTSAVFDQITRADEGPSAINVVLPGLPSTITVENYTFTNCASPSHQGSVVFVDNVQSLKMRDCHLLGTSNTQSVAASDAAAAGNDAVFSEEICRWNGSLFHLISTDMLMQLSTVAGSPKGGLSLHGATASLTKCEFRDNNPQIANYDSVRRNIFCENAGKVNITALKGGDGQLPNSSLWISSEECTLAGIIPDRASPLFIPTLSSVDNTTDGDNLRLTFKGNLLLPCNLSFKIVQSQVSQTDQANQTNQAEQTDQTTEYNFSEYVNENEVVGFIPASVVSSAPDNSIISVSVQFPGLSAETKTTELLVLKNNTKVIVTPNNTDDPNHQVQSGNEETFSIWIILFIIIAIVCLIVVSLLFVQYFYQKRKIQKLKNSQQVPDSLFQKSGDSSIELVDMDVSKQSSDSDDGICRPESGRVYPLGGSDRRTSSRDRLLPASPSDDFPSSEKLSGSYLVDVNDDHQRGFSGNPSDLKSEVVVVPAVTGVGDRPVESSASLTHLVEGVCCESPYETFIVDSRDSLYAFLHEEGGIHKEDYPMGTQSEVEVSAARILFWIISGCQQMIERGSRFDVLTNLSSRCVLFYDNHAIVLALPPEFNPSEDSSSTAGSSISSESSISKPLRLEKRATRHKIKAKEQQENIRWLAPELVNKEINVANEASVAYSLGMILWEVLSREVPYGAADLPSVVWKISSGEYPDMAKVAPPSFVAVIQACLSHNPSERPSLMEIKKAMISHFPDNAFSSVSSAMLDLGSIDSSLSSLSERSEIGEEEVGVRGYDDEEPMASDSSESEQTIDEEDESSEIE